MRGSFEQRAFYSRSNAINIGQYVVIPEAQDTITFANQIPITHLIGSRLKVLATISFDYQLTFTANEITDILSNALLPNELAI